MRNQIKLPNINFNKGFKMIGVAVNKAGKFIEEHKIELLAGVSVAAITDNIRVRFARKNEQKMFEQSVVIQKEVVRKHEAEINVLKAESKHAEESIKKVEELEQIVKKMTEGGNQNE